jgi:phosphoribosylformylglycinamidine synthase
VPITGGNVSFYNETLGRSIDPTPILGVLGVLEDAAHALGMAFQAEGDAIVLLDGSSGVTPPDSGINPPPQEIAREFSSSEYAKTIGGIVAGAPPAIDLTAEKRLIECLVALARQGLIRSAHDVSDGGLAVMLAESCFASEGLSAQVRLKGIEPAETALFGERGARAVVSVSPGSLARVEAVARQYGVATCEVGNVARGEFRIEYNGRAAVSAAIEALRDAWANALERTLQGK